MHHILNFIMLSIPNKHNLLYAISTEDSSKSLSIICYMPFSQRSQQKAAKVVIWDISKIGYEFDRKSQGQEVEQGNIGSWE